MKQSFEEILKDSGYSIDQVRAIVDDVAAKQAKRGAAQDGKEATPQTTS